MKALIVHPYSRELGGARQVFLQTTKALVKNLGKVVILGELSKQDFNNEIQDYSFLQIPYGSCSFRLHRFQVYQKLFWHLLSKKKHRKEVGCVELEMLTQDVMFLLNVGKRKVAYVHYPENLWRLEGKNTRFRDIWKIFYFPVVIYLRQQARKIDLLLCNSEYTERAIMRKWRRKAKVVYPPVDVESFSPAPKEDLIISVGRFVRPKNFELIIEVAKKLPQFKFIIVGRRPSSDAYFRKIANLKPSNLTILADLSRAELCSLMNKAKVYLHTMIGEHFGISVVEAMAAGCIPIVNAVGGSKEVIGNFGFTYNEIDECVACILKAFKSLANPEEVAEHAKRFSSKNFREEIVRTLEQNGFLSLV